MLALPDKQHMQHRSFSCQRSLAHFLDYPSHVSGWRGA